MYHSFQLPTENCTHIIGVTFNYQNVCLFVQALRRRQLGYLRTLKIHSESCARSNGMLASEMAELLTPEMTLSSDTYT